jgi:hypothetical protein
MERSQADLIRNHLILTRHALPFKGMTNLALTALLEGF